MFKIFNTLSLKNKRILIIDTWLVLSIGLAWYFLVHFNVKPTLFSNKDCFWYTRFGYYCPGCGGTRAFESMLYGHFIQSLIYHPFVLYILSLIIITFISFVTYFISRGNIMFFELELKHMIYADFIFVVYWLFKNLLIFYFNIYLL